MDSPIQCLGGGMVDAADSKSAARKGVRVRVSPEAPNLFSLTQNNMCGIGRICFFNHRKSQLIHINTRKQTLP